MNFSYSGNLAKTTYRKSFEKFLGVDYASSKLNVSPQRAVEMSNLIYRNGVNQKRYGWEEVFTLGEDKPINGFWQFKDSNKNIHTIVHGGTKIYSIDLENKTYEDITHTNTYVGNKDIFEDIESKIKNEISYGIVRGERLYLLLGEIYCVYGTWDNGDSWELRPVMANEDTYIPVTTIGITANGSSINIRTVMDEVNLLNIRRKNKLIGEDEGSELFNEIGLVSEESYYTNIRFKKLKFSYHDVEKNKTIGGVYNFDRKGSFTSTWTLNYDVQAIEWNDDVTESDLDGSVKLTLKQLYNAKADEYEYNVKIYSDEPEYIINNIDLKIYNEIRLTYQLDSGIKLDTIVNVKYESSPNVYTEIDASNYTLDYNLGTITFNEGVNYPPLISGQNNIIVEFTGANTDLLSNADKINKCRFGKIFGYNDLENLFVSGNEDYPNYDWHTIDRDITESNNSIKEKNDLTYFGELSYAVMGSPQNKITGYSILGDNTLAIHKEYSPTESSLHLRTSYLGNVRDLSGDLVVDSSGNPYQKVYFSQVESGNGEGSITPHMNVNLNGDKLFLSKNGVYGIVLNANIKSNERYARERSRNINPVFTEETNLQNAYGLVLNNMLYVAINNKLYIADSRFKSQLQGELDDTFSYEWYIWNNIPARLLFVHNDKLYFGTIDGKICTFNKDIFYDYYVDKLENGITKNNDNSITINSNELQENDEVLFEEESCFEILLSRDSEVTAKDIEISLDEYNLLSYYENDIIYVGDGENKPTEEAKIVRVEYNSGTNKHWLILDKTCTFRTIYFEVLNAKIMKDDDKYYLESKGLDIDTLKHNKMVIFSIDNTLNVYKEHKENVVAKWKTPIYDLGNNEYSKNLKTINVVFEPVLNGNIKVGYKATYNRYGDFTTEGVDGYDAFNDLNFNNFSFVMKGDVRSYTKQVKLKKINFIQLYYESDNDKNCCIDSINLTYILQRKNKGIG